MNENPNAALMHKQIENPEGKPELAEQAWETDPKNPEAQNLPEIPEQAPSTSFIDDEEDDVKPVDTESNRDFLSGTVPTSPEFDPEHPERDIQTLHGGVPPNPKDPANNGGDLPYDETERS